MSQVKAKVKLKELFNSRRFNSGQEQEIKTEQRGCAEAG